MRAMAYLKANYGKKPKYQNILPIPVRENISTVSMNYPAASNGVS